MPLNKEKIKLNQSNTKRSWCARNGPKSQEKGLEMRGRMKIIQTTALQNQLEYLKSSGNQRRLAVTETSVKSDLLKLLRNPRKE